MENIYSELCSKKHKPHFMGYWATDGPWLYFNNISTPAPAFAANYR